MLMNPPLLPVRIGLVALAATFLTIPPSPAAGQQPTTTSAKPDGAKADSDDGDLARKAEIMNSARWRRAIFELGEWLSTQQIYSPQEVHNIKTDFNRRVAAMSSFELEYLLDDLDAKFKVMDTPEARDAKQWLGQYLSVMSDSKRASVLKDVPNVVQMSSAQLQQEINKIEQMRASLAQRQAASDQSRQQMVEMAQSARQATAAASNAAASRAAAGASYSPYRGQSQGGGKPPFSDVKGSGMNVGVGPFGAYVNFNVGNF